MKPINIFSKSVFLYFPKKDLITENAVIKAGEYIHRFAFMHGAVRLTMSKSQDGRHGNKVIYIGKIGDSS